MSNVLKFKRPNPKGEKAIKPPPGRGARGFSGAGRYGSGAGDLGLTGFPSGLLLMLLVFGVAWTALVMTLWRGSEDPLWLAAKTVVWLGPPAVYLWMLKRDRPLDWAGIGLPTRRVLLFCLAALVVGAGKDAAAGFAAGRPLHPLTLTMLLAGAKAALWEEFPFRGVVQTRLKAWFGPGRVAHGYAIVLSAMLFTAAHIPGWTLLHIHPTAEQQGAVFLVGVLCGTLRAWSGSLWPAIAYHAANDVGAAL